MTFFLPTLRLFRCGNCGHVMRMGRTYCGHCGTIKKTHQQPFVFWCVAVALVVGVIVLT